MDEIKNEKLELLRLLLEEFRSETDMWIEHLRQVDFAVSRRDAAKLKRYAMVLDAVGTDELSRILGEIKDVCFDVAGVKGRD